MVAAYRTSHLDRDAWRRFVVPAAPLLLGLAACSQKQSEPRGPSPREAHAGEVSSMPARWGDAASVGGAVADGGSIGSADAGQGAEPPAFAMPKSKGPFEWRSVLGSHYQIVSPPGEAPAVTDRREGNRGSCREGMIEVSGNMKVASLMDERQRALCTKWIAREFPERCASFDRDKWLAASRDFPRRAMHFCIDRYEYPNRRGEFPIILVNWVEAKGICEADKKRLCTENEWTFACEGEEATPYPYGYVRDGDACLVDLPWIPFNPYALGASAPEKVQKELARLWQGEASGNRPRCRSVFGVYDMIGNVDEWTQASSAGRPSILKGGYWGPVRTRCRPTTRAHGEMHVFYQQGFRCCSDPPAP